MKGKPEPQLRPNQLLQVVRSLYGLADSGNNCQVTFLKHIKTNLGIHSTYCDLVLFFKKIHGALYGFMGRNIDDTLGAGNGKMESNTSLTARRFDIKRRFYDNLTFTELRSKLRQCEKSIGGRSGIISYMGSDMDTRMRLPMELCSVPVRVQRLVSRLHLIPNFVTLSYITIFVVCN